jgi:hypothetical protein
MFLGAKHGEFAIDITTSGELEGKNSKGVE